MVVVVVLVGVPVKSGDRSCSRPCCFYTFVIIYEGVRFNCYRKLLPLLLVLSPSGNAAHRLAGQGHLRCFYNNTPTQCLHKEERRRVVVELMQEEVKHEVIDLICPTRSAVSRCFPTQKIRCTSTVDRSVQSAATRSYGAFAAVQLCSSWVVGASGGYIVSRSQAKHPGDDRISV